MRLWQKPPRLNNPFAGGPINRFSFTEYAAAVDNESSHSESRQTTKTHPCLKVSRKSTPFEATPSRSTPSNLKMNVLTSTNQISPLEFPGIKVPLLAQSLGQIQEVGHDTLTERGPWKITMFVWIFTSTRMRNRQLSAFVFFIIIFTLLFSLSLFLLFVRFRDVDNTSKPLEIKFQQFFNNNSSRNKERFEKIRVSSDHMIIYNNIRFLNIFQGRNMELVAAKVQLRDYRIRTIF